MSENNKGEKIAQATLCYHCGTKCPDLKVRLDAKYFCCEGCKLVYELLEDQGFCKYYDLNQHPGLSQKFTVWRDKFTFLDLPEVRNAILHFSDGNQSHVHLYLPQMHCSSCLWLLEQVHKFDPGIIYSRVHFTDKKIHIAYEEKNTSLRKVVELLTTLGYEPQIDLHTRGGTINIQNSRKRIVKIGVAGFCFANIMMLSLPEYFSGGTIAETSLGHMFSLVILILSLPVFFYAAGEFFAGAWKGIRARYVNIDLPIALAIALTFGRSLYEMQAGLGNGYMDSMSGIVFFMLVGRFVQDRSNRSISFDRNYKSFFPIAVMTYRHQEIIPIPIEKLRIGDCIYIHNQEIVPVDGELISGEAELDYSFVTGESVKILVAKGEKVFAGARQTGSQIQLKVIKPVEQSYLTSLWNRSYADKNDQEHEIDRIGKYFTMVVLMLAGIASWYWYQQERPDLMWNAMTTILIVACPCALLLASNYTHGNVLKILAKNKLYLRHADVLEQLAGIGHIVFDKTGTLTEGTSHHIQFVGDRLTRDQAERVYSLARQSNHPLSVAIYQFGKLQQPIEVHHFKQWEGKGIEAWIDEHHLKLGSAEFTGFGQVLTGQGSSIHVYEDGKHLGYFLVRQVYRTQLDKLFNKLQGVYELSVISGDQNHDQNYLSGIVRKEEQVKFNCMPEDKLHYIQQLQNTGQKTLMIGDGLNDAGALKQSNVGIAVTENKNNFSPACDAILDGTSFGKLPNLLKFVHDGRRVVFMVFIYSFLYNIIGSYFALQGILSPVIAAILMPASSISIVLLTSAMTYGYAVKRNLEK
ncbi:MAG: heavy metal translocating P-type ATPase metal-binding domain-containing protein [Saprospiraceae bacterium]|nr:heavy metal translocating P-type ATPase metal-binding domain-containing protein [Saprospiraceae bacterium]